MSSSEFEQQLKSSYLSGASMGYIDDLYEDYIQDPHSVPESFQAYFASLASSQQSDISHKAIRQHFLDNGSKPRVYEQVSSDEKQADVAHLINAYRTYGHLAAKLDPLHLSERTPIDRLQLNYYHLSDTDKNKVFHAGHSFKSNDMTLADIQETLEQTYCQSIGIEYMHIANTEEIDWLKYRLESTCGHPLFSDDKKRQILHDLMAAEGLERYLGTRYVGQKRFSLEGGDALIPLVKEFINLSGEHGVNDVVIGMAHRGRLNVLINVLGKDPDALFKEFEGEVDESRTGDVKYHMGFSTDLKTASGNIVHVALAFNPSHLEIIDPVVQGSVRSRLRRRNDLEDKNTVVPLIIHGDAAFAGQGVVMETFNFSQARGYCTGGTVHIVINNQIGFTTSNPLDARSTLYCTDVAKMVQAPILHVNGEDPEAVLFATQIALDYRMKFKRDVVIDLVCYRRHGHNEADEPSVTQPFMYQLIKQKKSLPECYADKLVELQLISRTEVDAIKNAYRDKLDEGHAVVSTYHGDFKGKMAVDWTPYLDAQWTDMVDTTIDEKTMKLLADKILELPKGFTPHPVVKRLLQDRQAMADGEIEMNWGFAETMAYASLLHEGHAVRLSGQDSGRGTFAHRHAVLHDAKNGDILIPLEKTASNSQKPFVVIDSVLSEEAVLAFEYGYAASEPDSLILWEAQFGDFVNGAQVVIDQFISSGEQKWGRLCGLVMLLPHGYEGQGPEHSSARLERFMQLCAQQNIQVCNATTPAQIFHLLRRQVIRKFRKPLIIMTPKSLLRHKLAVSPLTDLTHGQFHPVIGEIDALKASEVDRIVICSGKVYYDLLQKRRDDKLNHVVIIRCEQLYPFPKEELTAEIKKYSQVKTVVWCQEEPQNQGAWFASQHNIKECLDEQHELIYAGRPFAAAPAVGSPKLHAKQQQALVDEALLG